MKKYLYFYIIAYFMMANDALFNWIGAIIGIPFWRQLIWMVGVFILIIEIRKTYQIPLIRKVFKKYMLLSGIVAVLAVFTLLTEGFNIIRIIMSFFEYFFGLPFLIFPLVCAQGGWERTTFNRFFIILGCFTSTGLLLDFLMGGAITSFFQFINTQSVDEYQFEYYGRFSFLSTTDSIFTLMLCLSTFCCFHEFAATKRPIMKLLLLAISTYIIFGSIFTGARQTLAALLLFEACGLIYVLRGNRAGIVLLGTSIILFLLALPVAQDVLSKNVGFENRFNKDALQEDERGNTWNEGFRYCFVNTTLQRLVIGDGVGYTLGTYAGPGESKSRHYENTFLARIIDVGVPMALTMLLTPIFIMFKLKRKRKVNLLYFGFALAYIFIGLISPNAASNQSQMTIFILLALFFDDNDREKYFVINQKT